MRNALLASSTTCYVFHYSSCVTFGVACLFTLLKVDISQVSIIKNMVILLLIGFIWQTNIHIIQENCEMSLDVYHNKHLIEVVHHEINLIHNLNFYA